MDAELDMPALYGPQAADPAEDISVMLDPTSQKDVRQHGRDVRALRRAQPRVGPLSVLHHARVQPFLDQPDHSPVPDPMLKEAD